MNKCYSTDNENYCHTTLEDALDAMGYEVGGVIYEAFYRHPKPSSMFSIDTLIEQMSETAYDEYGEYSEDYMSELTEDQIYELDTMISEWLDKNVKVRFWEVYDAKELIVTEELVKSVKGE